MSSMIMKAVDGRERTFAIRDEQKCRNGVVFRKSHLDMACLIAVALLFAENFHVVISSRRRRKKHTVEHLLACCSAPFVEVLDAAFSPSEGIIEVSNQLMSIHWEVSLEFIFRSLLCLYSEER